MPQGVDCLNKIQIAIANPRTRSPAAKCRERRARSKFAGGKYNMQGSVHENPMGGAMSEENIQTLKTEAKSIGGPEMGCMVSIDWGKTWVDNKMQGEEQPVTKTRYLMLGETHAVTDPWYRQRHQHMLDFLEAAALVAEENNKCIDFYLELGLQTPEQRQQSSSTGHGDLKFMRSALLPCMPAQKGDSTVGQEPLQEPARVTPNCRYKGKPMRTHWVDYRFHQTHNFNPSAAAYWHLDKTLNATKLQVLSLLSPLVQDFAIWQDFAMCIGTGEQEQAIWTAFQTVLVRQHWKVVTEVMLPTVGMGFSITDTGLDKYLSTNTDQGNLGWLEARRLQQPNPKQPRNIGPWDDIQVHYTLNNKYRSKFDEFETFCNKSTLINSKFSVAELARISELKLNQIKNWPEQTEITKEELRRIWFYSQVHEDGAVDKFLSQYLALINPKISTVHLKTHNEQLAKLVEEHRAADSPSLYNTLYEGHLKTHNEQLAKLVKEHRAADSPSLYNTLYEGGEFQKIATEVTGVVQTYICAMRGHHELTKARFRKREAKVFVDLQQLQDITKEIHSIQENPNGKPWGQSQFLGVDTLKMDYYTLLRMLSSNKADALPPQADVVWPPQAEGSTSTRSPCLSKHLIPAHNIHYAGSKHAALVAAVLQSMSSGERGAVTPSLPPSAQGRGLVLVASITHTPEIAHPPTTVDELLLLMLDTGQPVGMDAARDGLVGKPVKVHDAGVVASNSSLESTNEMTTVVEPDPSKPTLVHRYINDTMFFYLV